MAKHTQTIRRQFADELLECVWPFYGIGAERVNANIFYRKYSKSNETQRNSFPDPSLMIPSVLLNRFVGLAALYSRLKMRTFTGFFL